jgi:hypothetical protein
VFREAALAGSAAILQDLLARWPLNPVNECDLIALSEIFAIASLSGHDACANLVSSGGVAARGLGWFRRSPEGPSVFKRVLSGAAPAARDAKVAQIVAMLRDPGAGAQFEDELRAAVLEFSEEARRELSDRIRCAVIERDEESLSRHAAVWALAEPTAREEVLAAVSELSFAALSALEASQLELQELLQELRLARCRRFPGEVLAGLAGRESLTRDECEVLLLSLSLAEGVDLTSFLERLVGVCVKLSEDDFGYRIVHGALAYCEYDSHAAEVTGRLLEAKEALVASRRGRRFALPLFRREPCTFCGIPFTAGTSRRGAPLSDAGALQARNEKAAEVLRAGFADAISAWAEQNVKLSDEDVVLIAKVMLMDDDLGRLPPVLQARPLLASLSGMDKVMARAVKLGLPEAAGLLGIDVSKSMPRTAQVLSAVEPESSSSALKVIKCRSGLYEEKYGVKCGASDGGEWPVEAALRRTYRTRELMDLVGDAAVGVTRVIESAGACSPLRWLRREIDAELEDVAEILTGIVTARGIQIRPLAGELVEECAQFLENHFDELREANADDWWGSVAEMRAAIGETSFYEVTTAVMLEIAALSAPDGSRVWLFRDMSGETLSPKSVGRLLAHEFCGHNRERSRLRRQGMPPVTVARCVSPILDRVRFSVGGKPIESGLRVEVRAGYTEGRFRPFCVQRALKGTRVIRRVFDG